MVKVRVLISQLAYGPSPSQSKTARTGDVIELTEEELSRLTVAPAYPATVELVQEERKPIVPPIAQKGKMSEHPK